MCLQNLKKTFKYGGRKHLLSAKEIEAITVGQSVPTPATATQSKVAA